MISMMLALLAVEQPVQTLAQPWAARAQKTNCQLEGTFSSGGNPILVRIASGFSDQTITLTIEEIGAALKPVNGRYTTSISSERKAYTGWYYSAASEKVGYRVTFLPLEDNLLGSGLIAWVARTAR